MSGTSTGGQSRDGFDYDVVVVGGGPTGCSAGVFTARYDLDTAVFDRGRSSIRRCGFLDNYLGFPNGVDIDTFYALMHDHAEQAGCTLVSDLVESVTRMGDGVGESDNGGNEGGFVVEPQEGPSVTTRAVIAATRYDGEYLRALGGEKGETMFETHDHDGEVHEHFDRSYADADGSTPVDGLYVASPSEGADRQAILAAGRGARAALTLVDDSRRERGYFDNFATHYDWQRRESELTGEWADRDRWREYADGQRPDDHDVSDEQWTELREAEIDRRFDTYLSEETIERRTEQSQLRLLEHVDDELIVEYVDGLDTETANTAEPAADTTNREHSDD